MLRLCGTEFEIEKIGSNGRIFCENHRGISISKDMIELVTSVDDEDDVKAPEIDDFLNQFAVKEGVVMKDYIIGKPYDVGMICGRFQTFHIGHESLVEAGLKLCDRLLILIGSAQEYGTERNPLNINTRTKMLKEIYGDSSNIMIYGLSDLTNEHDITPDWGRYLLNNADRYVYKVPELMISGNDEERNRWFAPEDVVDMSELIVNRGRIPISATMIRKFMVENNRKEWMKWVNPKLHKLYDELRAELMTVPFYRELK